MEVSFPFIFATKVSSVLKTTKIKMPYHLLVKLSLSFSPLSACEKICAIFQIFMHRIRVAPKSSPPSIRARIRLQSSYVQNPVKTVVHQVTCLTFIIPTHNWAIVCNQHWFVNCMQDTPHHGGWVLGLARSKSKISKYFHQERLRVKARPQVRLELQHQRRHSRFEWIDNLSL